MKSKECGHEIKETIIIDGIEYEKETHDFDKMFSDIKIPKGWEI